MTTIRLSKLETVAMRDRIRLALDEPDTERGRAAQAELRAFASQLAEACGNTLPPPVTAPPVDESRLN